MTDEKQRWAVGRGVPLTRLQWILIAVTVVVDVVGMTVFIIMGNPTMAGGVGGIAALILVGVNLGAIGARNDRIVRGK